MTQLWAEIGLFIVGWAVSFLSSVTNNLIAMEIGALALSLAGIVRLLRVVTQPERYWATCSILAAAGLITYCLGNFLTLIQYDSDSIGIALTTGADFIAKAFVATSYLGLFYWALAIVAVPEAKWWRDVFAQIGRPEAWRQDIMSTPILLLFLLVVGAAQVVSMASGAWSYEGADTTEGKLPVIVATIWLLSQPVPAIAGWLLGRWRRCPKTLLLAVISCGLVQVPWLAFEGRRPIAFGAVTFLTFYFWSRGKSLRQKDLIYIVLWAIPAAAVIYFAAELFLTIRFALLPHSGGREELTLSYLLSNGFDIVLNDRSFVHHLESESYGSRFFIFQYLSLVVDELTPAAAQGGLMLAISFFAHIPSILFPNKTQIFWKNSWFADGKAHVDAAIGLPVGDSNFSPFVQAYGDFLWSGAIIYPLVICAFGWVLSRIVKDLRSPIVIVGALGVLLMQYIAIENTLGAFIGTLRPLALLWLLTKFLPARRGKPIPMPLFHQTAE